jgi:acyl-CoA synthetase (AMP-forming)/AMP-acid ligase II
MDRLDCSFYQSYGMTEMSSVVTALLAEDHFADNGTHLLSVGRPIQGAEVKVVRDDGSSCGIGEVGEILVKGRGRMLEYYKQPTATANAFSGGWYCTKDAGYLDEKGYLYIRGRKDSLIISGGENIYPEEVSNVILKMEQVAEVAVYGVPDEKWGERPKAFVTLQPGRAATESEIIDFCRGRMAHFKCPAVVEFGELPKTSTGKIQKHVLREREWAGLVRRVN